MPVYKVGDNPSKTEVIYGRGRVQRLEPETRLYPLGPNTTVVSGGQALLYPSTPGYVEPIPRQTGGPTFPLEQERQFRNWFSERAKRTGTNPDPDDPRHYYDARGYWKEQTSLGQVPSMGHLPDRYKLPGHPYFSIESVYYKPGMPAGHWEGEHTYIPFVENLQSRKGGGPVSPTPKRYTAEEKERDKMQMLRDVFEETKRLHRETPPKKPISRQMGGETTPSEPYDPLKDVLSIFKTIASGAKHDTFGERYRNSPLLSTEKSQGDDINTLVTRLLSNPTQGAGIPKIPTPDTYTKLKNEWGSNSYGQLKEPVSAARGAATYPEYDPTYDEEERLRRTTNVTPPPPVSPQPQDELATLRSILTYDKNAPVGGNVTSDTFSAAPEIAARERWSQEGYPEKRLKEIRAMPGLSTVFNVSPAYEPTYYETPKGMLENLQYAEDERKKEYLKPITEALERQKLREQGYGLGMADVGPLSRRERLGRAGAVGEREGLPGILPGLATIAAIRGEGRIPGITSVKAPAGLTPQIDRDKFAVSSFGTIYRNLTPEQKASVDKDVEDARPEAAEWRQVKQFLRDKLKREPTDTEVYEEQFNRKKEITKAGVIGKTEGEVAGDKLNPNAFTNWAPEVKERSFETWIVNGQTPLFGRGMAGVSSRIAWDKELNEYLIKKNQTAEGVLEKRYFQGALSSALKKNVDYRTAVDRFARNVDTLAERVTAYRKQYGPEFGRLANTALNNLRNGIAGSGELVNLQQMLASVSLEVAKMESGELGISAANESQQRLWGNIHNYNYNPEDLEKILNESANLGKIRLNNLDRTTNSLRQQLIEPERYPGATPGAAPNALFPPVGTTGTHTPAVIERRRTKDGRTLVKYSDGTIKEE